MKKKDLTYLALTAFIAGIISFLIASFVFKVPLKRNGQVPTAQPINATFPDVKKDQSYSSFLNTKALDPTQNIQIGSGQNSQPFSTGR